MICMVSCYTKPRPDPSGKVRPRCVMQRISGFLYRKHGSASRQTYNLKREIVPNRV